MFNMIISVDAGRGDWKLAEKLSLPVIPRIGEFIAAPGEDGTIYYKVLTVVYGSSESEPFLPSLRCVVEDQ